MEKRLFKKPDMTIGNPLKVLLIFAIPIFLGQIIQQFYNVADTKIIGMKLGDTAIAAMGSVGSITYILIGIVNGLNNGCAITVARYYGAGDMKMLRRTFAHMIGINLIGAGLLSAFGIIFVDQLMGLMEVPVALQGYAKSYLIWILGGMLTTITYNMCAAVLRSVGDSRTPLFFLIGSSIINIGLDLLFVMALEWGVGGAAAATVIAQALSALLCIIYIRLRVNILHLSHKDFVLDVPLLKELLSMGFSMGLITSLVAFGSAAVTRANNILEATHGSEVITATSASKKIDGLFMMPMSTLGTALSTFVSQNRGAGHIDRINKAIKGSFAVGAAWCALGITVIYIFGGRLVTLITDTDSAVVIDYAETYMRINAPFFLTLMALLIFRSVLQGLGKKLIPISTAAAELVLKFFAAGVLVPYFGFIGICVAEPIIWALTGIAVTIVYIKDIKKLNSEKTLV